MTAHSSLRQRIKKIPVLGPMARGLAAGLRSIRNRRLKRHLAALPSDQVFQDIYRRNQWGSAESISGRGSELKYTGTVRTAIRDVIRKYEVSSILDLPCGDFNWMQELDLRGVDYLGADIVPELIDENRARFESPSVRFEVLDLTSDALPSADLLICRDCLVHLSYDMISKALDQVRESGCTWLLTTTYPGRENEDIVTGWWRPIDLQAPPFNFPEPGELVNEGDDAFEGAVADKSLALWRVDELPLALDPSAGSD
jgi:SAM-dependent methyltransferase